MASCSEVAHGYFPRLRQSPKHALSFLQLPSSVLPPKGTWGENEATKRQQNRISLRLSKPSSAAGGKEPEPTTDWSTREPWQHKPQQGETDQVEVLFSCLMSVSFYVWTRVMEKSGKKYKYSTHEQIKWAEENRKPQ